VLQVAGFYEYSMPPAEDKEKWNPEKLTIGREFARSLDQADWGMLKTATKALGSHDQTAKEVELTLYKSPILRQKPKYSVVVEFLAGWKYPCRIVVEVEEDNDSKASGDGASAPSGPSLVSTEGSISNTETRTVYPGSYRSFQLTGQLHNPPSSQQPGNEYSVSPITPNVAGFGHAPEPSRYSAVSPVYAADPSNPDAGSVYGPHGTDDSRADYSTASTERSARTGPQNERPPSTASSEIDPAVQAYMSTSGQFFGSE
jgi:hypothetical protein